MTDEKEFDQNEEIDNAIEASLEEESTEDTIEDTLDEKFDEDEDATDQDDEEDLLINSRNSRKIAVTVIVGMFVVMLIYFASMISQEPAVNTNSQVDTGLSRIIESIPILEQATKNNPQLESVWVNLGNAYYDTEQWEKAITSYKKALEINPKDSPVRVDMAVSYFSVGNSDKAIQEIKNALEVEPSYSPAYFNLGIMYGMLGKNKDAIAAFEKFLVLDPQGEKSADARSQIQMLKNSSNTR